MADKIEEEKRQHHATLAAEHERKAEWHKELSGGEQPSGSGKGLGGQIGDFFGSIAEHKWFVIGGIAAIIVFIIAMKGFSNQSSGNTANTSPDLSQGGYVPSNISTALDSINSSLSGLSSQIANMPTSNTNTPPPSNTNTTPPPSNNNNNSNSDSTNSHRHKHNPPPSSQPTPQTQSPQPQYVTVTPWPTSNSTLWGISQGVGLSLSRIEQLNPNLYNQKPGSGFDLIYPGQKVRIS